jgi:electron transport complex protein RnfG
MLRSAVALAVFAAVGVSLVALTHAGTRERIQEVERAALVRSLSAVVDPSAYDNDLTADVIEVRDPTRLGTELPVTVYRARKDGRPVAIALTPIAPDGYAGSMRLMVGVLADGRVSGVRVLSHRETPGLGDLVEERRSDWILRFAGRSLEDPKPGQWKVRRDGGVFDQFTGATITPRAVVRAVRGTLEYVAAHREELFAAGLAAKAELERRD